ncbi:hypothetical protein [Mucilaginibacter psychrotolerans]|uniref:Uncharacterized protein n=1 Tax=Mucilaginibacter psychrotolerans TaxID=1524096 RepID=A0A4Y8S3U6_9SPHI|nr:hypothetical protein [Mucilaginibacter psychrotolerans]TFF33325.1 hypothetical protein E2R66_26360 [Mucilaginibacter psychrotolerans]
MDIQLIEGQFSGAEALDLLTAMIHVKIRFHENKISRQSSEQDIKSRERRIKQLQKDLFEIRAFISKKGGDVTLKSVVAIQ